MTNSKKRPVGLHGISIGKRELTEHLGSIVSYLHENFERGIILVADEPKRWNNQAIDGMDAESAAKKARRDGLQLEKRIKAYLPNTNVEVYRWEDMKDDAYQRNLASLEQAYAMKGQFKQDTDLFVAEFLGRVAARRPIAKEREQAHALAARYRLEELAMLASVSAPYDGLVEVYPEDSEQEVRLYGNSYPEVKGFVFGSSRERWVRKAWEAPLAVAHDEKVGYTLVAARDIRRGEHLTTITGPIVEKPSTYTIPLGAGLFIDPANEGKYLCHSCEPNAGFRGRNQLVAMKDIVQGERVAADYAMIVPAYDQKTLAQDLACKCASELCRGEFGSYQTLSNETKQAYKGFVSPAALRADVNA